MIDKGVKINNMATAQHISNVMVSATFFWLEKDLLPKH